MDFAVAALCLWAAAYHTPVGALARRLGAWAAGTRSSAQPLLAYYSAGVYDANEVQEAPPFPPGALAQADLTPAEALGYGLYATWARLDAAERQPGRAVAQRYGLDGARLDDPKAGPAEAARVVEAAAKELDSEDAAVAALFCGFEPAAYAAGRVRAAGAAPTLERISRALPPGFADPVTSASRALTLGTAYALAWPVPEATRVTSPFGYREHPMLGRPQLHTGVDLAVPVGTEVRATASGIVRRASEDALNGRVLLIDHGRGVTTAYCHNSELEVRVGQAVARGEVISRSGNTGRSTGPHLHYQLELGHSPVDPLLFHARAMGLVAAADLARSPSRPTEY